MDRALRANLRKLGFTSREIEAIDSEEKALRPKKAPKTSAAADKQRRYRARKRAEQTGEALPGWARRRRTDDEDEPKAV